MKKIILSVLVLALIGAAGTYYYAFVYSKNRKFDMVNAEAMTIEANTLVKAFQDNEADANKNYLEKYKKQKRKKLNYMRIISGKYKGKKNTFSEQINY
jgi:hypothetical protein